jgi:hypothetical protein
MNGWLMVFGVGSCLDSNYFLAMRGDHCSHRVCSKNSMLGGPCRRGEESKRWCCCLCHSLSQFGTNNRHTGSALWGVIPT